MDKYSSASAAGHKRNKYTRREHHTHSWRRCGALYFSLIQLSLLLNGEPSAWSHVGMAEHSCHNIAEPALDSDRFSNGLIQMCVLEHYKLLSIIYVRCKKSLECASQWRTFMKRRIHILLFGTCWRLINMLLIAIDFQFGNDKLYALKAPCCFCTWNYIRWYTRTHARFALELNRFHAPLSRSYTHCN